MTFWFTTEDGRARSMTACRSLQWRIDGSAVGERDFLLCVNMDQYADRVRAAAAACDVRQWVRVIDTAAWAEPEGNCWPPGRQAVMGSRYVVHPYAIAVFAETAV